MKHFIALSSLFLLSACAGTQQLVAVQPDGSKIVENSFYQQTAFGTDSRMNVISVCDPRCNLVSLSGRYSSGYGRAVTTQLAPSVATAVGFAVGMNNLRPSNTNISTIGGSAAGGSGLSSATGGAGGAGLASATGGTSNAASNSNAHAGSLAASLAASQALSTSSTSSAAKGNHHHDY